MNPSKIVLAVVAFYLLSFATGISKAQYEGASVNFLDVGQGDAILITTSNGKKVLIDGGPDNEIDQILYQELGLEKCKIDVMVLTHPHKDHLKGLSRVLTRCDVTKVVFNDVNYDSRLYSEWKRLLGEMEIDTVGAVYGDRFFVDNTTFHVIWPTADALTKHSDNVNDTSIVLFMDVGRFEVLLTGDAEKEVQSEMDMEMIKSLVDGPLEILKVAHHGSKGSLNEKFVSELDPDYAVFTVGENSFGHPHEEVVEFYESLGSKVMRTDVHSSIMFAVPSFSD